MADSPQIHGSMRSVTLPPEAEAAALRKEALALRQAENLTNRGHRLLDLAKLERVKGGRYVVHTASHELFRHVPGEPRNGRPLTHAFGITDAHELRWYEPAEVTIDELLERDRRASERGAAEHERQRKAKAANARTVTWADVYGDASLPPTLRAVAERLHLHGGTIRIEEARLVVGLPPSEIGQGQLGVKLARYLYAASEAILEAVKGKAGPVAPSKLPARALLPSGRLAP